MVLLGSLICACSAALARADATKVGLSVPPLMATAPEPSTFEYREPQTPNYLRASLEVGTLVGIGFALYVSNHDLNSQDWDFAYSWTGLRRKLSPRGYSFDTNGFDTNFIRHSAAGTTYYWAARANRLSILESLVAAFIASTLWEYVGELRERASLNDILTTPLTGMVLGELTMQLGAFFDRSCDVPSNRILGALLGPIKTVHDLLDGATPLREQRCDRLGMSLRGAHHFELSLITGLVGTVAGPAAPLRPWTQLALHTQITALETFGRPGEGVRHFADGNVSELRLSGSFARTTWSDFSLRGTIMPLGLHYRSITPDARGYEVLFGLILATEYTVHRFGDWQSASRRRDRYFELNAPGAGLQVRWIWGPAVLTLELQAAAVFVGADALALPELQAQPLPAPLPTVAEADGYNYALGMRLRPCVSLSYRGLEAGAEIAAVRAGVITVHDRFEERDDYAQGSEHRALARAWLSFGPLAWPLRLTIQGSWLQRWGSLGGARARRAELHLGGGLALVF